MTDGQTDRQTDVLVWLQAPKMPGMTYVRSADADAGTKNIEQNSFRLSFFAEKFKTDRTDRIATARGSCSPSPFLPVQPVQEGGGGSATSVSRAVGSFLRPHLRA